MHPILFHWGPLTLYSYGLMVALGFLAGSTLATRRAVWVGLDPSRMQSLCLWVLLAGLVGARTAYVLLNWNFFRRDPLEIVRIHHGGLVFYGGLFVGLLVGFWILVKNRWMRWEVVDLMIPPLVIAHAIGRLGCFLNGCCYGKPSALPWAVSFSGERLPRHPTQLYEAGALLLIFLLLRTLEKRTARSGTVTLVYGVSYGLWRFLVEFLRGDNPIFAWGLTVFQWMSLFLLVVSGWALCRRRILHP